jgi:hypothetical protein
VKSWTAIAGIGFTAIGVFYLLLDLPAGISWAPWGCIAGGATLVAAALTATTPRLWCSRGHRRGAGNESHTAVPMAAAAKSPGSGPMQARVPAPRRGGVKFTASPAGNTGPRW